MTTRTDILEAIANYTIEHRLCQAAYDLTPTNKCLHQLHQSGEILDTLLELYVTTSTTVEQASCLLPPTQPQHQTHHLPDHAA